jgi:urea transport system ATP-binding protein
MHRCSRRPSASSACRAPASFSLPIVKETRARLLLLDEPAEGIQPNVVQEIGRILGNVRRELGVAILIVEQHLDFAWSITDRYYVMQRGTVVKTGTTATESPEAITPLLSV